MTTTSINLIDAKEALAELIHRVSHHKEHIVLTRRGKEVAAIIPIEDLARLQHSQSKTDLEQAVDALQEARNQGTITLEDFKDKLG